MCRHRTQSLTVWTTEGRPGTVVAKSRSPGEEETVLRKEQIGSEEWIYEGAFEWPMDSFGLELRYGNKSQSPVESR
jgi:hypothetical protein